MSRQAELSDLADQDIFEISLYIARNSIQAANRFVDTLNAKFQSLADSPGIGLRREELGTGIRSFPVGNYVVFYRPIENGIQVLRVLHGARDLRNVFGTADEEDA